ncbi:MAG: AAA family ATPase [Nanoarchaeota archaeon]|nr:AAA family ATPase [Nanoarchaeota archaeon]
MKIFIALEGIDGAGKTSIGKMLEEKLGFAYYATPPQGYKPIRRFVSENAQPMARFLYYMAGNIDTSHAIKDMLKHNDAICDRYVFSTLIPHSIRERLTVEDMLQLFVPYRDHILMPDTTIVLDVEPEEQIRRLTQRNQGKNSSSDRLILENTVLRREFRERYIAVANRFNWPVIDTSGRDIEEIMKEVIEQFPCIKCNI